MEAILESFHPLVRQWFVNRFGAPSPVQRVGWPVIGAGHDTLLCAPTGSGKTLAAFLWAIDRLVRDAECGNLRDEVSVVYVSPLKALANDIRVNLEDPLKGISEIAQSWGRVLPEIRAMVRTGDTMASERGAMRRRPPHILVTTPESLFILLTSKRFAQKLSNVRFVIVDELHALAGSKRGAHLAITLERLERRVKDACGLRPTRIGLSATLNPVETLGQFLCGYEVMSDGSRKPRPFKCANVYSGARQFDLKVLAPGPDLGPLATHQHWEAVYDELAELIKQHRTTLVFTLSRRSAERIALNLQKRLGENHVMAHHGSLARRERLNAEQRLKRGELKVIVATSSLELGIDVGSVELVCQIDSPRSISAAIQRIGRSGHMLGGTPKGRFFALTADDLLECAALVRAIRRGLVDEVEIPLGCLDVAAQQTVAIAAEYGEVAEDEVFRIVGGAYNFKELDPQALRNLLFAMAQETSTPVRGAGPLIFYDPLNGRIRPRRGARMVAITCGGTIPDPGNYDVVIESEGRKIGEVEEDFAQESSRGDVFALGSMPWQIQRTSQGRLLVEPAPGMAPTLPFWHSEAPGRSRALSAELCELRNELLARCEDEDGAVSWLCSECGMEESAARQAVRYVKSAHSVLGVLPDLQNLVIERFFDGLGCTQLVFHSPFGMRINRGFGLALRKRLCRNFNFEIQASATDDGVLLSLNARHSFVPNELLAMLPSSKVREVFYQAILDAPMFETRFRHVAGRSLMLRRANGGKAVPAWIQRLRAQDLLVALFPEQQACFENRPRDVPIPDHYLIRETLRECSEEATDIPGVANLLRDIEGGRIHVWLVDSLTPSIMAQRLLLAWDYAFLDDGERANRRSRTALGSPAANTLFLPSAISQKLDPVAIEQVRAEATGVAERTKARDADELYEMLRRHGILTRAELAQRADNNAAEYVESLIQSRRVIAIHPGNGLGERLVAVEDLHLVKAVYPELRIVGQEEHAWISSLPIAEKLLELSRFKRPDSVDQVDERESAVEELVRRTLKSSGPLTEETIAQRLGLQTAEVHRALVKLEAGGYIFRGRFTAKSNEEWCERTNLERIHRLSLERLHKTFEPCGDEEFVEFLLRWHHIGAQGLPPGIEGVAVVLEQLAGLCFTPQFWEETILKARVPDYRQEYLDLLCANGRFCWVGLGEKSPRDEGPSMVAILPRSESALWLDKLPKGPLGENDLVVLRALIERGAQFLDQLCARLGMKEQEVLCALMRLASAGLVSNDSFVPVRVGSLLSRKTQGRTFRRRFAVLQARIKSGMSGRWSALGTEDEIQPKAEGVRELALALLRRHGILAKEITDIESVEMRWPELKAELRRLEYAGIVHEGYFVRSLSNPQYALPEALEVLRAIRDRKVKLPGPLALSAADPANPYGVSLAGISVAREASNFLAFVGGKPVLALEGSKLKELSPIDDEQFKGALGVLLALRRKMKLTTVNDEPALKTPRLSILVAMGFYSDGLGLVYNEGLPGPRPCQLTFV